MPETPEERVRQKASAAALLRACTALWTAERAEAMRERCAQVAGDWALSVEHCEAATRYTKAGGPANALAGVANDIAAAIRALDVEEK